MLRRAASWIHGCMCAGRGWISFELTRFTAIEGVGRQSELGLLLLNIRNGAVEYHRLILLILFQQFPSRWFLRVFLTCHTWCNGL